jgi:tetraacyldisaccharide 4'-kinase
LGQPLSASVAPAHPEIGPPVGAFCAIGNPDAFVDQLRSEGYELAAASVFPDHHRYDQRDVDGIIEKASKAGAKCLITTAKDAVKLHGLTFDFSCYVLDIEIRIDDELRLIEMIRAAIGPKVRH